MKRRPRRVIPATVVALVLLAICVAVAVSLIQKLSGSGEFVSYHSVAARLHGTTWDSGWVLGVGIGAAVLGLLLLITALVPGRAVVLPLEPQEGTTAGITRRSLRAALDAALTPVTELESGRVRVRAKKIHVYGRIGNDRPESVAAVRAAVENGLARIGPQPRPEVITRLRPTRARRVE